MGPSLLQATHAVHMDHIGSLLGSLLVFPLELLVVGDGDAASLERTHRVKLQTPQEIRSGTQAGERTGSPDSGTLHAPQ